MVYKVVVRLLLTHGSAANITLNIDVDVMAGAGLVADNTNEELDVNVDDSTIEISSDALRIKDSGVTLAKLPILQTKQSWVTVQVVQQHQVLK